MASDNLVNAALGALEGFNNVLSYYQKERFAAEQRRQDELSRLNTFKEELPLEEASKSRLSAQEATQQQALEHEKIGGQKDIERMKLMAPQPVYDENGKQIGVTQAGHTTLFKVPNAPDPNKRLVKEAYPEGMPRPDWMTHDLDEMTVQEANISHNAALRSDTSITNKQSGLGLWQTGVNKVLGRNTPVMNNQTIPGNYSIDHNEALNWANNNPNDPRAAIIKQRAAKLLAP